MPEMGRIVVEEEDEVTGNRIETVYEVIEQMNNDEHRKGQSSDRESKPVGRLVGKCFTTIPADTRHEEY
jgi:hypothetical protein